MSATFDVEYEEITDLEKAIKDYPGDAEEKINTYLHGEGYETFAKAIQNAMPVSGRNWKGKAAPAKHAKSLQDKYKDENLAVTVRATNKYNYLYFPNDGENTVRHVGNQRFFERGVEQEADNAVNDMLDLLKFEE